MQSNRRVITAGLMQGMSHADTKINSPCAASEPACKSPDRPDAPADVGNALYSPDALEPSALLGAFCNKYNLVDHFFERDDQSFNKRPALVHEKILLLAIRTPCLTPNEYNR